MSQVR